MTQRVFTNQVFSNTGIVGEGFKINFFEAGTTTPQNTFSNEALTIANSNPIIADENGRFIDVFVSNIRLYKSVLTDTNNNVLKTLDPIDPDSSSLDDFDPRPLAFWGITTGTANNYILTADPTLTSNKSTDIFALGININCNASCDLTIDSQSTKDLKKYDGAGSKIDLEAGDLQASQRYFITDDGVDYIVLAPVPATESAPGIAPIATQAEVDAKTDDTKIVTSLKLANFSISGLLKSVQTFTASGTWTKPANINGVRVQLVGAGGGGSGAGGSSSSGVAGTATSFGSHCSGNGGGGGGGSGAGGSSSNGDINIAGGSGQNGINHAGTGLNGTAGNGGNSFFGGSGKGSGGSSTSDGTAGGSNSGGGGGGGFVGGNSLEGGDGGGSGGYSEKLITSGLGATETITIGTGGAGGSGNGGGGSGANGLVIVYEYT